MKLECWNLKTAQDSLKSGLGLGFICLLARAPGCNFVNSLHWVGPQFPPWKIFSEGSSRPWSPSTSFFDFSFWDSVSHQSNGASPSASLRRVLWVLSQEMLSECWAGHMRTGIPGKYNQWSVLVRVYYRRLKPRGASILQAPTKRKECEMQSNGPLVGGPPCHL